MDEWQHPLLDGRPEHGVRRREFLHGLGGSVLIASAGGTLLAACGEDEEQSGPKVGGTLRMLSFDGYEDEEASAAFRKRYGVRVRLTPVTSAEEYFTQLRAGSGSRLDLVSPTVQYAEALARADLIAEIDYSRIPNAGSLLPSIQALVDRGRERLDGKDYFVPYLWGDGPLLYNKKFIKEAPASWRELLEPSFNKKLAMADETQNNIMLWSKVLGFDPPRLSEDELGEVTQFLTKLKKDQVRVFGGTWNDVADSMAKGDVWAVASGGWEAVAEFAAEKGGEVDWVIPEEGTYMWVDSWAISKEAPNPATAYAWINAMLSPKPQSILAEKLISGTVNTEAVELLDPAAQKIYPYNDQTALAKLYPYDLPPLEPTDGVTTLDDWEKAFNEVRAA